MGELYADIIVDISQKTQMALDIIVKISNSLKNSKISSH